MFVAISYNGFLADKSYFPQSSKDGEVGESIEFILIDRESSTLYQDIYYPWQCLLRFRWITRYLFSDYQAIAR